MLKRLRFTELTTGRTLQNAEFDAFNLLVGLSGMGKSWTLHAIKTLCHIGAGGEAPPSLRWTLEAQLDGQSVRWSGQTDAHPTRGDRIHHTSERVEVDGALILERSGHQLSLRGTALPPLDTFQSSVALFQTDPLLGRLSRLCSTLISSIAGDPAGPHTLSSPDLPASGEPIKTLRDLQEDTELAFSQKLAFLEDGFPTIFQDVVETYRAIFPNIRSISLRETQRLGEPLVQRHIEMQEHGISVPIPQWEMSSGMLRTLLHLFELKLAAPGSVVLIDELENSLGYNCLAEVSDLLYGERPDLQFIVTSHHPYILNHIPRERWKLVHRAGTQVTITPASQIPALQTRSRQDSFTLLLRHYDRLLDQAS